MFLGKIAFSQNFFEQSILVFSFLFLWHIPLIIGPNDYQLRPQCIYLAVPMTGKLRCPIVFVVFFFSAADCTISYLIRQIEIDTTDREKLKYLSKLNAFKTSNIVNKQIIESRGKHLIHIDQQKKISLIISLNCSDPQLWEGGTIYSNGFFVQSFLADRYIHRTEMWVVSSKS